MELNNLKILINSRVAREVKFNQGLNLITNKKGIGRSGNSVGKSTLSRVVDYLFLGSIDPIYIDEEFKKPNEKIESLFTNSEVEAQLTFIGLDMQLHVISRNLCVAQSNRKFYLDGRATSEAIYEVMVQKLCFDVSTKRPSVRSIAPKFIRNDSHRMLNTTKFLDQHVGSKDYSELFLYLFGFKNTTLLTEKRDASNLVSRRKRNSTALNAIVKEQKPATEIEMYKEGVQQLERDFLKFDYSPEYINPVARLSELQIKENDIVETTLGVNRKIENIKRTVDILEKQGGNYLVNEVRAIYEFASASVESAIRKYEDVLSFHDVLVSKKKQFLSIDLPELNSAYSTLERNLETVRSQKLAVFSDLRSEESIANITNKLKELGNLKITLGKLEGLLDQQRIATKDLGIADDALKAILKSISNELDVVLKFGSIFNIHFKRITNQTHAEPYEFSLNFDENSGICHIDIINNVSNPEGGKKKAEVIAYDFAYIWAVDELKIKRPKFVFHDSIEDIDQKQIDTIFTLAKSMPGQQIVSMLSDKFSDEMYLKYLPNVVLLLSEDNMFFGV